MRTPKPWLEKLLWVALGALLAAGGHWALSARPAPEEVAAPAADAVPGDAPAALPGTGAGGPECYLGVVIAREAVDVAAEMEGAVKEMRVRVGDAVERGAEIAALDTVTLRHQLAIERANLASAEAQERRHAIDASQSAQEHQRRLALEGVLSKEEEEAARFRLETAEVMLEAAVAEVTQVEARIDQLESTLERARIRAPFAGTVAQRYLDPGARVSPGTPVVRLLSSGGLLARFAVPPEEAPRVPVATPVRVEVEDLGVALAGVVEHQAPEIDAASQMVFVEARLETPGEASHLPSGAVARVSVARAGALFGSCLRAGPGSPRSGMGR
jgi:RND family efflux transporter MFP subunit